MEGISEEDNKEGWSALLVIFTFNLFDGIGRVVSDNPRFFMNDRLVLILLYSRAIFIVTFILSVSKDVGPSWLFGENSDWFKVLNMVIFSFSNGYIAT